jgi:formylglycine-generating enzyme required for sulfatase activity/predicted Ser/Thr protein kinase
MSDYEIHEDQILGEGGMGTVCRGRQISLDRQVAIKIIRHDLTETPTYVERFRREAELLGQVIDGHVVQVFGAGEWKGRLFYAMEYIEGEDLASRLARGQTFSLEDLLHIAHGVGRALKAAWKYQIVHRDIKPSNILITSDYRVKVADFGLARSLAKAPAHTMTIAGTAKYLSPEQGLGDPVDIRSDIYSLGVVLFELATRQAPFDGDSPTSVIYSHVHAQPPSVKDLCPAVRDDVAALIMKCLSKKPEHRFQNPDELLDAVSWIRAQIDPLAFPLPNGQRPRRVSGRRLGALAGWSVMGGLLVTAIAYASLTHFSEDPALAAHNRKAIETLTGLGNHEEAMELARKHFGMESKEFERANRAYRAAKVQEWERLAKNEAAARNWKQVVKDYEVMLQFADGERKDQVTAGHGFYKILSDAVDAEAAGQWARALELYDRLQPAPEDLKAYLLEARLHVRDELAKARVAAAAEANRSAEPLIKEARKLRGQAAWAQALEKARLARDLVKPFGPVPADWAALVKELEKATPAPEGFVYVPAGPFAMGADDGAPVESPRHRGETGAFFIAVRAVTRAEYAKFLEDLQVHGHLLCPKEEPENKDHIPTGWSPDLPKDEPVTGVDWLDAVAYARFTGTRLPTEAEWEKAAAYQSDEDRTRRYPWGDALLPAAKDVSFFGAHGMGRGPLEWTQSVFEGYPGSKHTHADFGRGYRVLRGGLISAEDPTKSSRANTRRWRSPVDRDKRIGFRVAKDVNLNP